MAEHKAGSSVRSEEQGDALATELKATRDTFLHTFFRKGAELTEDLVKENERLHSRLLSAEEDNASLRKQLASDAAIREFMQKVEELEREKSELISHIESARAVSTRYSRSFSALEDELGNLANLYVASYQLHTTLKLDLVFKHLNELLGQLVGSDAHALFIAGKGNKELVPVLWEGLKGKPSSIEVGSLDTVDTRTTATIERVFLTGIRHIVQGSLADTGVERPAACIPIGIDDRILGVIVIYSLLAQKPNFVEVDFELFKLLGAHAASSLIGSLLSSRGGVSPPWADDFLKFVGTQSPATSEATGD